MYWADSIGAKYIHGKLEEWTKRYGSFFKPCSYLAERAAKGIPLVSKSLSLELPSPATICNLNCFICTLRKNIFSTYIKIMDMCTVSCRHTLNIAAH